MKRALSVCLFVILSTSWSIQAQAETPAWQPEMDVKPMMDMGQPGPSDMGSQPGDMRVIKDDMPVSMADMNMPASDMNTPNKPTPKDPDNTGCAQAQPRGDTGAPGWLGLLGLVGLVGRRRATRRASRARS